jgi:trimethylamine--corrinoid protein Co-methyltransferase
MCDNVGQEEAGDAPQEPRDQGVIMTHAEWPPSRCRLGFLTDEDKGAIYEAALEIAESIGMRVHHAGAVEMLRAAGGEVVGDDLVRMPRTLIEQARSTAPATITMYDREGAEAMQLGGYRSYFGTGSDLMNLYDLDSGVRRKSVLADVARAARLCDALDNIDFVMSSAYATEVDPRRAYLEEFRAMVANTTKPIVVTAENGGDLAVIWQVACVVRGGADKLADKPYFVMYGQPSSPLEHPFDSIEKVLFCADKGVPTIYSPAPMAGATAPITVAGHIAQGVAESLFGLVIHQLRKPGAPFLFGIGPAVLDMATAQSSYNAPEYLMTYLGAIEMARWLDLPNWGYGGTSDAQLVDAQAGMEAAELTLLSMLAGSNLNHDVGYLDFGLTGAFELIVIVDEFIAMNRRLLAGLQIDRDTLGLDTIAAVGPGGDFLATRHTAKHMRGVQWRPTILNRKGFERWREDGGLDLREKARRKALDLLANHESPPLSPDAAAKIDALVDRFAAPEQS